MLEEERTKRMNELEKMAKRHKKKQKYPMSIFPDYKKGAEEFNKNSTPINQDALSSADASSGMAEDIERNKKKGINEEMDDFLYWEIAEPQCTGYDCDSNIEYVYGDNEDRVWIEEDGKKYKVYVNQWDTKPTATFTSLKKAKAFGEKYWQDNYGYIDESLKEEYIPDFLNERFTNGTLADFNPHDLMDKVKSRLEAINTVRTNGNMIYMISIHPHGLFVRLSPETKYDVFIVSEDEDGNQEWVSSYEEFSNLLDTEVVNKLNDWKNNAVSVNESFDNDDYDRPVLDKSNRVVNSLISNLNSSGFEVEDYEIKDKDIVVRFYDDISDRNLGFLRRSFSGPTKAISSVTALDEYHDNDDDVYYNNIIFELQQ